MKPKLNKEGNASKPRVSCLKISESNRKRRGGLVVRPRLRSRKIPHAKPESTDDPPCLWAWCRLNLTWVEDPPADMAQKFGLVYPRNERQDLLTVIRQQETEQQWPRSKIETAGSKSNFIKNRPCKQFRWMLNSAASNIRPLIWLEMGAISGVVLFI
ncbi:hypothetical protein AVEN_265833-1 [Araneus ventricosus]|uniref:Uncharacterized protein n=1 Tax=Araneus ventricosus TaxID=182803 RepID=A0A4Y2DZP6_ARAVE|nr:hypothetical protein AVEN_265833-1 [Araneus ventricosus]